MLRNKLLTAILLLAVVLGAVLQMNSWRAGGWNTGLGVGEFVMVVAILGLILFAPNEARSVLSGRLRGGGRLLAGTLVMVLLIASLWVAYTRYYRPMTGILSDPDSTLMESQ